MSIIKRENEPVNQLEKTGLIVEQPTFIIDIYTDNKLLDTFGINSSLLDEHRLDYAFYRAANVTLSEKDSYHEKNHAYAVVHMFRDNGEFESRFLFYKVSAQWRSVEI